MTGDRDLISAIEAGDTVRVRKILGDDPGAAAARSERGLSALMYALYLGRHDIAAHVAAARQDLDVFEASALDDTDRLTTHLAGDGQAIASRSVDGWTPLHLAAFFGQAGAVRVLLGAGADIHARSDNDMANQPLHAAAANGCTDVCQLLIDAGADVNATQQGGATPLHSAAMDGDEALVELLLAHGADPSKQADDGTDAAGFARRGGHDTLAAMLDERTAASS